MNKLILILLAATAALAQAAGTHTVTLTWQDSQNPAGTTYSIYRATGLCSGTPTFSKIASAVNALTYQDASVTPGNYCYAATATVNGMESSQSNQALAPVPSFAPTSLSITVQ